MIFEVFIDEIHGFFVYSLVDQPHYNKTFQSFSSSTFLILHDNFNKISDQFLFTR